MFQKNNMPFIEILHKLKYIILCMRPKQWIKNNFVFAGLLFSRSFLHPSLVLKSIYAFILFSVVSGSVYLINDVIDREKDALHPSKRTRPIASKKITVVDAVIAAFLLLSSSLYISYWLHPTFCTILLIYFIVTCLYSLYLKHFIILDVMLISLGFVLRTVGGGVVIHVTISPWLILCTTLITLFMALIKRKNEILTLAEEASNHRKILGEYSLDLINQMLSVITSTTLMSYCLYTFNADNSYYMMLTIPFVIYGIFRYQYLSSIQGSDGSPEQILLHDVPLLIDVFLWITTCTVIVLKFS